MTQLTSRIHDLVSAKAILPLLSIARKARPALRPVMRAFDDGLRFRRVSAGWSPEQKREWILERLRFTVRRAFDETAYYRQLFLDIGFDPREDFGFEDFARIPPLGREEVREAGADLISSAVPPERLRKDSTGGSTGEPTLVWLGQEEIGWRDSSAEYFKGRMGVPEGTRTGLLWGHHLDAVASDSLRDRFYAFATNQRWFDCFRLSPDVLERYHQEFERWRPACIVAYAGALGALAEYIEERGYRPGYPTRCFVTGAEKLMPHHRKIIERVFKRPVHERYGSRDVGHIGFQLRPEETLDYEIDWANMFVEPESDGPEPAILITKLHADGMPMLRYRIGDAGHFPEGCLPGHPSFTLREVVGRIADRVWLRDGRWINGLQMPHMMKDFPIREFKLVQRADYSLELNIIPADGFGDESQHMIRSALSSRMHGLPLMIKLVDEIPRTKANKWRPVVSEVEPERKNV